MSWGYKKWHCVLSQICSCLQPHSNTETHLSYLVQPNLHGKRQRLPSLKVLWINIFSYSGPTEKETLSFRRLCKLFSKALKPPCWTSFPHPNYSSLTRLFNRLNELSSSGSINIPSLVLIENGVHVIEDEDHGYFFGKVNMVNINIPISISGESREYCIVMGGLMMKENKEYDVNVSDLTVRDSKGHGVCGDKGASIHLDNVSVENSKYCGVAVAPRSKSNTMKNCNVSHSKDSGLCVWNGGLMTIDGKGTTIHHNCTKGNSGDYGLHARGSSSSIHLASSLTIETISKNNGGDGNHGGPGTIQTVTNNTKEEKK